jgi:hypothetical protein
VIFRQLENIVVENWIAKANVQIIERAEKLFGVRHPDDCWLQDGCIQRVF